MVSKNTQQTIGAGDFFKKSYSQDVVGSMVDRGFTENLSNAYAWQYSPLVTRTKEAMLFSDTERDPNYNYLDDVEGYEEYLSEFTRAKNKDHAYFIKQSINRSRKIREDLANTSWYYPSQLIAGVVDPLNLAFALPVFGQLGMIAKGGMTAMQAFRAGATGGFTAGLAGEVVRAPFDPVATKQETLAVLTASTFLGGALSATPAVFRNAQPALESSITKMKETLTSKGEWVNNMYDDVSLRFTKRGAEAPETPSTTPEVAPVVRETVEAEDALVVRETAQAEAPLPERDVKPIDLNKPAITVNKKENAFEIDEDVVQFQYDTKAWSSESIPEHIRLRPEEFQSKSEYQDFLIHREKVKMEIKREKGQKKEDYDVVVNLEALNRTHSGYGQKKTRFSNSIWYKALTMPSKRILLNDKVNDRIKRYYEMINGNAANALERNITGRGLQSIIQRQPVYFVRGQAFLRRMEKFYEQEVGKPIAEIAGLNLNKMQSIYNRTLSFDEWFSLTVDRYIELSERWGSVDRYENLTVNEKEAFETIRKFFDEFDREGAQLNLWRSERTVDEDLARIKGEVERKQSILDGLADQGEGKRARVGLTKKQLRFRESLQSQLKRHAEDIEYLTALKANGLDKKRFYFPIYYNKQLLQDPVQRERFTDVIEGHVRENPKPFVWSEKQNKMVERDPSVTDREIAEGIVRTIMEESDVDRLSLSGIGSKHTRMRTLDIPEWKVKDFIIKDVGIIDAYTRKMGNKIEWTRKFGKRNIDDLLEEIEEISFAEGKLTEKEIRNLKRDFVADYEYSMGIHIRSPDRWDAQTVRLIKDVSALTYLHNAGIASVTDAAAIAFEHGFGNVLGQVIQDKGSLARQLAKKEIQQIVKGTDMMLSQARDRMFADSISRLQPNAVERVMNPINKVFYDIPIIGNNLGMVTRFGKITDATLRQAMLVQKAMDIASNKAGADIEYWGRYGLSRDDAIQIASYKDKFVIEDGFIYANRMNWPSSTPAERELLLRWDTALNSGTGNTIMMATAKDKPIISRGVVYIPWHPWMKDVPFFSSLTPDKQVSTANFKYARIESGVLTFPFQFMDFTLAATNRITANLFDPARRNRLQAVIGLWSMGYLALELKKEDWWFENKGMGEIIARSFDHSGIAGVYSDIFYMGLHMALGFSGVEDTEWLHGKYRPTPNDALLEPFGAGPGLLVDWTKAVSDMLSNNPSENADRLKYLLPFNNWSSMAYDFLTKD